MKKIFLICLLFLGNVGMAGAGIGISNEIPAMETFFKANRDALELAKEICLEEKVYLTENFAYSCGLVGKLFYKHVGSDKETEIGYKLLMKACDSRASAFFGEACYLAAEANDSSKFKQPALAKKYFKRTMEYLPKNCDWEYEYLKKGGDFLKSTLFNSSMVSSKSSGVLSNDRYFLGQNNLFLVSGYYYGKTCSLLGKIYDHGWFDIQRDKEKALMYFGRVCEMEESEYDCQAVNRLKQYLERGQK